MTNNFLVTIYTFFKKRTKICKKNQPLPSLYFVYVRAYMICLFVRVLYCVLSYMGIQSSPFIQKSCVIFLVFYLATFKVIFDNTKRLYV